MSETTWTERIVDLFRIEKHEIGRAGLDRYLTRWVLWGKRFHTARGKLFLHQFHRGDAEPYLHDHPWPFWSLILWGGYWEWTPLGGQQEAHAAARCGELITSEGRLLSPLDLIEGDIDYSRCFRRRWYGPGFFLRRPANWRHKVDIPQGKRALTLVWTGPKERSWGFVCPGRGWIHWREHEANQSSGRSGCGN